MSNECSKCSVYSGREWIFMSSYRFECTEKVLCPIIIHLCVQNISAQRLNKLKLNYRIDSHLPQFCNDKGKHIHYVAWIRFFISALCAVFRSSIVQSHIWGIWFTDQTYVCPICTEFEYLMSSLCAVVRSSIVQSHICLYIYMYIHVFTNENGIIWMNLLDLSFHFLFFTML